MPQAVSATAPAKREEYREVLRPFGGPGGRIYQPGEIIETSTWKNGKRLVQLGRLSELIRKP